ncbi:MAG: hypothetical protein J1F02_01915 [Lachnospiraceae bacterium]|nr:hypothetical protein [Lachnospiraceae bacterium]
MDAAEKDTAEKDTVRFRVSLVVLPVDDFTGNPITGSQVRVFIPGQKPPVIKSDGYHVFLNLQEPQVEVCCESGLYGPRREEVVLPAGAEPLVIKLRLSPNASYPMPPGATCVAGRAEPGRRIRFRCADSGETYRLSREYQHTGEEKDTLCIFNPNHRELEGKTMFIQGKDGKQEYFTAAGLKEEGCRLAEPLQHDYKKVGTVLYPVFETYTSPKGDFFLLLGSGREGETTWLWEMEGKEGLREAVLAPGRINRLLWKEEM